MFFLCFPLILCYNGNNIWDKGELRVKIQESAENYLESVLILQKQKGHVRSIDIVNYLDFSKPSVSVAMKNLRENGYIHMDDESPRKRIYYRQ